ncbi:DMT family transporter [Dankookia rubra]|uniref:DMT family transporter n=1 Tax=Dankookia rubra TaxID=1442381 RepID=UPI0019D67DBB|nr:DMT family transporter [Dankookia rubra]
MAWGFALLAGALITVQAGANSQLKQSLGTPMPALLVNYVFGFGAVLAYALATRVSWPALVKATGAPWWAWLGGLAGAVYGVAAILLASRLGAATLMALVVTSQLFCSVLLDHFGWVGFEVHPAGWGRVAGCVFMAAGFALIARF